MDNIKRFNLKEEINTVK